MIRASIFVALVLVGTTARAAHYTVAEGSLVQFVAHITGGSFTAKTSGVRGGVDMDDKNKVTAGSIVVNAGAFESGMAARDSHMRDKYLETDKYPLITLDLAGATLPPNGLGEADVDGTFEVHGVKKPVRLHVKVADAGNNARRATSEFQIDVTDFGIAQPKFAVVKMDTKVDVSVDIRLAPQGR